MTPATMLRLGAALAAGLLLWKGASAVWQLKDDHDRLQRELLAAETQRDTARQVNATQARQLDWLQRFAVDQQQDARALITRLEAINHAANLQAAKLEAAINENDSAKQWAATLLPAAVASVLDNTAAASAPAGAGADRPAVPAGNGLPAAALGTAAQRPAGGGTAADAGGA